MKFLGYLTLVILQLLFSSVGFGMDYGTTFPFYVPIGTTLRIAAFGQGHANNETVIRTQYSLVGDPAFTRPNPLPADDCGYDMGPDQPCTVYVDFTPTSTSTVYSTATLSFQRTVMVSASYSYTYTSTDTMTLKGIGIGPSVDLAVGSIKIMQPSNTPITINPDNTGTVAAGSKVLGTVDFSAENADASDGTNAVYSIKVNYVEVASGLITMKELAGKTVQKSFEFTPAFPGSQDVQISIFNDALSEVNTENNQDVVKLNAVKLSAAFKKVRLAQVVYDPIVSGKVNLNSREKRKY